MDQSIGKEAPTLSEVLDRVGIELHSVEDIPVVKSKKRDQGGNNDDC